MTYTLEIPLDSKGFDEYLKRRFEHAYKLKREVINWYNRQEHHRQNSDGYKALAEETKDLAELRETIAKTTDKAEKKALQAVLKERSEKLKKEWNELNKSFGLDSSKYVKYKEYGQATNMYYRYAKAGLINATTFQDIAATVKKGYLERRSNPSSSNFLKVPREVDYTTIWIGMANKNIRKDGVFVGKGKKGHVLPYRFRRRDDEIRLTYALDQQRLALYALKRTLLKNNRWKYSVLLVFDGVPYGTLNHLPQTGKVAITLNVEKMAIAAESNGDVVEYDLSNDHGYSEKLSELDRKIERSRRLNNPDNYKADGQVKPGRLVWHYSNNYKKLLGQKRHLWHKIKEARKHRFGQIANSILQLGDEFELKADDFKALQKRKEYDKETMNWFDTRKQRGFEIMFNAPYEFVTILSNKLTYHNIELKKI